MHCPYCGFDDSHVVDSRPSADGDAIRRRRECAQCHQRFTSYERVEAQPLLVIKKDGSRERFDTSKIRNGIITACHKRPISAEKIEEIVTSIEQRAANSLQGEITTQQIGEMVMEALRQCDEVAYVRFASVYRSFTDIPTFMEELQTMLNERIQEKSST